MDIAVYFRKPWMIFLIGIILLVVFLFGVIPYVISGVFSFDHSMLEILLIPLLVYGLPLLWQGFHALFLHQPALVITSTGIEVLPLNIPGCFFIRWSEIQRISVDQYFSNKYLCIHPKESKEYIARFAGLKRFSMQFWTPKGLPLMSVPLLYLDKQATEIFRQLSLSYTAELDSHHILLLP